MKPQGPFKKPQGPFTLTLILDEGCGDPECCGRYQWEEQPETRDDAAKLLREFRERGGRRYVLRKVVRF